MSEYTKKLEDLNKYYVEKIETLKAEIEELKIDLKDMTGDRDAYLADLEEIKYYVGRHI